MQDNLSQEAECCKISGRLLKTEFYRKIYDRMSNYWFGTIKEFWIVVEGVINENDMEWDMSIHRSCVIEFYLKITVQQG